MNKSESPTTIASKINWVDMAAVYGLGHSGEVVERALKTASQAPCVYEVRSGVERKARGGE
jgi:hypothetical protein